jgi:outer membrane protein assembly factor BamB
VYANGSDQRVHAYNAADGSQIWSSDAGQLTKDLLVTDKFIYATNSANLFIFDRSTGKRYAALGSPRRTTDFVFTSGAGAEGGHIFATLNFGAWSFVEP